jgi:hypothetical protein
MLAVQAHRPKKSGAMAMTTFIPVRILGGPFVGLLILAFSFKGSSAMGGSGPRQPPRGRDVAVDASAPLLDPVAPGAPRRVV